MLLELLESLMSGNKWQKLYHASIEVVNVVFVLHMTWHGDTKLLRCVAKTR